MRLPQKQYVTETLRSYPRINEQALYQVQSLFFQKNTLYIEISTDS